MSLNIVACKAFQISIRGRPAQYPMMATWRCFSLKDRTNVDDLELDLGCPGLPVDRGENSMHRHGSSAWRKLRFDDVVFPPQNYTAEDLKTMEKVDLRPVSSPHRPSPVEIVSVRGKQVYIKRDDLLRLERSNVSGNKARKMLALNQIPADDFPKCVVSYGGSQSNAMLALAAVVQSKNAEVTAAGITNDTQYGEEMSEDESEQQESALREKRFVYFTKKLPRFLKKNPSGNFFRAKALGMEVIELSNDDYNHLFGGDSGGKPDAPADLPAPWIGDSVWVSSVFAS